MLPAPFGVARSGRGRRGHRAARDRRRARSPSWSCSATSTVSSSWAAPLVIAIAGGAAIVLALQARPARARGGRARSALAALLAAPATWAAETLGHATSGTFPTGGPATRRRSADRAAALEAAASAAPVRRAARRGFGAGAAGGFGARRERPPAALAAAARSGGRRRRPRDRGRPRWPPRRRARPAGGMFGGDSTDADGRGQLRQGPRRRRRSASRARAARRPRSCPATPNVAGLGGFSGRESSVSASWIASEVRSGRLRWVLADAGTGARLPGDTRTGSQSAIGIVEKAVSGRDFDQQRSGQA